MKKGTITITTLMLLAIPAGTGALAGEMMQEKKMNKEMQMNGMGMKGDSMKKEHGMKKDMMEKDHDMMKDSMKKGDAMHEDGMMKKEKMKQQKM